LLAAATRLLVGLGRARCSAGACEVRHASALSFGPFLARGDELLHWEPHDADVGPERGRDLLAALTGVVLHVGEQLALHLLEPLARAAAALAAALGAAGTTTRAAGATGPATLD